MLVSSVTQFVTLRIIVSDMRQIETGPSEEATSKYKCALRIFQQSEETKNINSMSLQTSCYILRYV